jgi:UDP-N-acetylmuramate dehydrogenase
VLPLKELRAAFGDHLQENALMANYTTARVGGPADALLVVQSLDELRSTVQNLWRMDVPFHLLGSGSNVLVSDTGVHEVIVINHARNIKVEVHNAPLSVWVESGANLSAVARQVALRGLSGLEWASSIPGSIGGAVYGNAGANNSDMAENLILAEILHPITGSEMWSMERLEFAYRSSILKRTTSQAVVLAARLRLAQSTIKEVQARMDAFNEKRRSTQPSGASLGSMFKNPVGDYAGRLVEAAGLKGTRIGDAEISSQHANFMINLGHARAADYWNLIQKARQTVHDHFGIDLELEIEMLGDWSATQA